MDGETILRNRSQITMVGGIKDQTITVGIIKDRIITDGGIKDQTIMAGVIKGQIMMDGERPITIKAWDIIIQIMAGGTHKGIFIKKMTDGEIIFNKISPRIIKALIAHGDLDGD